MLIHYPQQSERFLTVLLALLVCVMHVRQPPLISKASSTARSPPPSLNAIYLPASDLHIVHLIAVLFAALLTILLRLMLIRQLRQSEHGLLDVINPTVHLALMIGARSKYASS